MKNFAFIGFALVACSLPLQASEAVQQTLDSVFQTPPDQAIPWTYWLWLQTPTNQPAMTKDLEAMKDVGLKGFILYDFGTGNISKTNAKMEWVGKGYKRVPTKDYEGEYSVPLPRQMPWTPPWNSQLKWVASESKRLGLEFCLSIGLSGFAAPGLDPKYSQQQLTWIEQEVSGPSFFEGPLAKPYALMVRDRTGGLGETKPESKVPAGYLDVAVMAVPVKNSVKVSEILNLTDKLDASGRLHWEVPAGKWKIISFGQRNTLAKNQMGLFCDHLSREAVDKTWDLTVGPLLASMSQEERSTLRAVQDDSWEAGRCDWTKALPKEFQKRRGYDLMKYLPVLAGYTVEDGNTTAGVRRDYELTISDLVLENYYGYLKLKSNENDMQFYAESVGPHMRGVNIVQAAAVVDHAMAEFWVPSPHRATPSAQFYTRDAATANHLYGRPFTMCEAFTSVGPVFEESPFSLKRTADQAFCDGMNRISFCNWSHSPDVAKVPGDICMAGTHFTRNLTWWNQAPAFLKYLERTSAVLQAGTFAADVVFYLGDALDAYAPMKVVFPTLGAGYDYDRADSVVLAERMSVKDGRIVLPDGMNYKVLALPEEAAMGLAALEKIAELVRGGATVVGPAPARMTGFSQKAGEQAKFDALVAELWGKPRSAKGERTIGKGRLAWGKTVREVLQSSGVAPAFEYAGLSDKGEVDWIQRTVDGADVFYVTSRWFEPEKLACTFRVSGKAPELWDPVSGERREANAYTQKDGRTTVPLEFGPSGSVFVVFRKPIAVTQQGSAARNYPEEKTLTELKGPWQVKFDPKWGGPVEEVTFRELEDWSKRAEEGIKYYSGTAVYAKRLDLPMAVRAGERLVLDLGTVHEVSEVKVNGKSLGVVWTKPARVDITEAVKAGGNDLEITVVNLWPNRLIGDAFLPEDKQFTKTNMHHFTTHTPLFPSGLLGPVTVLKVKSL